MLSNEQPKTVSFSMCIVHRNRRADQRPEHPLSQRDSPLIERVGLPFSQRGVSFIGRHVIKFTTGAENIIRLYGSSITPFIHEV